jgi:histidinol-phosphatase (PHP family)
MRGLAPYRGNKRVVVTLRRLDPGVCQRLAMPQGGWGRFAKLACREDSGTGGGFGVITAFRMPARRRFGGGPPYPSSGSVLQQAISDSPLQALAPTAGPRDIGCGDWPYLRKSAISGGRQPKSLGDVSCSRQVHPLPARPSRSVAICATDLKCLDQRKSHRRCRFRHGGLGATMLVMLPPDNHVHSEWSWDTPQRASMEQSCDRAVAMGLPAVAFTEHVDFAIWGQGDASPEGVALDERDVRPPLDISGYQASLEHCRERFPALRIFSGMEAGEPHLFAGSLSAVLKTASFDRVLGSLHALIHHGRLTNVEVLMSSIQADDLTRRYFAELLRVVNGSDVFEVLAHVDYPRRHWPGTASRYDECDFEEEYRAVFRALARTGRALEINTESPLASATLVRWWYDAGGPTVSFGSDAHNPSRVGDLFALAGDVVESAGFRPGHDRFDFWRR